MTNLTTILKKYKESGTFTRDEIISLLGIEDEKELMQLFTQADQVRKEYLGDEVHLRGIIEFSNWCIRNCLYCGINRCNQELARYRMSSDEILATAAEAISMGFKTVVLQSGEDFYYTGEIVADIVAGIKAMGAAVTLSLGERPRADYAQWKMAGADRYLLKFETSDPDLYARLHPGSSLAHRLRCLEDLRELGYQVGSGNMVGLPGQDLASLAGDILLMRSLSLDMAGIGPFIPHPATPLLQAEPGTVKLTLKVLAATRLLLPRTHLPSTTALGSVDSDGRRSGLLAGANVLMVNLTPLRYRNLYEIYPAKAEVKDDPGRLKIEAESMVKQLGRRISTGYGHGNLYKPKPQINA